METIFKFSQLLSSENIDAKLGGEIHFREDRGILSPWQTLQDMPFIASCINLMSSVDTVVVDSISLPYEFRQLVENLKGYGNSIILDLSALSNEYLNEAVSLLQGTNYLVKISFDRLSLLDEDSLKKVNFQIDGYSFLDNKLDDKTLSLIAEIKVAVNELKSSQAVTKEDIIYLLDNRFKQNKNYSAYDIVGLILNGLDIKFNFIYDDKKLIGIQPYLDGKWHFIEFSKDDVVNEKHIENNMSDTSLVKQKKI